MGVVGVAVMHALVPWLPARYAGSLSQCETVPPDTLLYTPEGIRPTAPHAAQSTQQKRSAKQRDSPAQS